MIGCCVVAVGLLGIASLGTAQTQPEPETWPVWLVVLTTVAVIVAVAVAVGSFAFWRENRNEKGGIASFVIGLFLTVVASLKLGLLAVVTYVSVLLLYNATGNARETIQLVLLVLGSLMGFQHLRIQAERSRQERDEWADTMQDAWTKSITASVVAKDQAARKRAADEARKLYRACRIRMNQDASLLLSRSMTRIATLNDSAAQSERAKEAREWLRGLIMPTSLEEPTTTIILDLFRAYRNGGPIGWYATRMLARYTVALGGMTVSGTGLVEDEESLTR